MLKFIDQNIKQFISDEELININGQVELAAETLKQGNGAGSDYLAWSTLPQNYDKSEFARIKATAEKLAAEIDVLVVIGIGGSYLGARAVIEMLTSSFNNSTTKKPLVIFAGNNLSSTYLHELIAYLDDKSFAINVISKSGTTTEPAIAFRIFRAYMEKRYSKEEMKKRIFVTTDAKKGALKELATQENYTSFVVPEDIGGRYSVLSAVGLFPIAVAGINIDELMAGALSAYENYLAGDVNSNDCYRYAAIRNILYRKGFNFEVLVHYEPSLHYFVEWWKQLFGESEGKNQSGIFPVGMNNTADLHSMGQYIQEGRRNLFETVLLSQKPRYTMNIPHDPDNKDGLNFLDHLQLNEVNHKAALGTIIAHVDGGVPNLLLEFNELTAYWIGELIYFFEKACAVSGYLNAVNPFNQPGVEAYKQNMFALLGKPGYEKEKEALEKRLNF